MSISGVNSWSARATVDFPAPIPPVSPTRSMLEQPATRALPCVTRESKFLDSPLAGKCEPNGAGARGSLCGQFARATHRRVLLRAAVWKNLTSKPYMRGGRLAHGTRSARSVGKHQKDLQDPTGTAPKSAAHAYEVEPHMEWKEFSAARYPNFTVQASTPHALSPRIDGFASSFCEYTGPEYATSNLRV